MWVVDSVGPRDERRLTKRVADINVEDPDRPEWDEVTDEKLAPLDDLLQHFLVGGLDQLEHVLETGTAPSHWGQR